MSNKKLNAVITIGGALSGSFKSVMNSTKRELNKIGSEVNRLKRTQNQLSDSIRTFGSMGKNVDNLRSRYSAVTAELKKLESQQRKLNAIENARLENNEKLSNLKGQIGSTIAQTFAVGATLYSVVSASSEFNYQMQMIGNTADMTKVQINGLKSEILEISKELASTPQEVQRAQGFLTAAGLDVGTATKMLRPIGKAAIATGTDVEYAARAAYTLQDSLNIQPDKMIGALDALAQAGKDGNFEFRAMAENLPVLGASFKSLKMEGKEAAATMGAALQIARKGAADEAEAANNMKNFMAKILSPTTLKKANKLGVDLYGAITKAQNKGGNPFEAAMEGIIKATKGGDQKLIGDMFQDMQVQNFLRPMIQQWDDYKQIKERALSATGVVDKDFALISETSKSWGGTVVASFKRMSIAIGDALEPTFVAIAKAITPVIDSITAFVKQNPKVIGSIVVALASVTAFRVGWLAFRIAIVAVRAPFLAVSGMFARLGTTLPSITTSFARFMPILRQVGFALMRTPWGAVAAVAIGAGLAIYKYWDQIKAFFSGFWQGLKQGIEPFTTAVSELIASVPFLGQAWDLVSTAVSKAWNWFKELLTPVKASKEDIEKATSAGQRFGQLVGGAINAVLAPLRMMIDGFKRILDFGGKVFDLIGKIVGFDLGSKVAEVKSISQIPLAQPTPPKTTALPFPMKVPKVEMPKASFVGEGFARKSNFEADNIPEAIKPFSNSKTSDSSQPARINQSDRREQVNHNSFSFTINAAPGQNPKEIAQEVMQKLKQQQGVQERNSMIDWGYAQ